MGLFTVGTVFWGVLEWANVAPELPFYGWWVLGAIVVGLLFTAAFLAWRDEHNGKVLLVEELQSKIPRIVPTDIRTLGPNRAVSIGLVNDGEPAFEVQIEPITFKQIRLSPDTNLSRFGKDDGERGITIHMRMPSQAEKVHLDQLVKKMWDTDTRSLEFTIFFRDFAGRWFQSIGSLDVDPDPMVTPHIRFIRQERRAAPVRTN